MDDASKAADAIFGWTWTGTKTRPGRTGKSVRIKGMRNGRLVSMTFSMGFMFPEAELRYGFESVDGAVGEPKTPGW